MPGALQKARSHTFIVAVSMRHTPSPHRQHELACEVPQNCFTH